MRIQEAYSILSDVSKRRQYDRQRTQKSSGNPFEGFSGFESDGAAREYAKRWRENNPMPEDIGDSFSKIFGDVFGEVRKGLDGGGLAEDFVEFLENMTGGGGKDVAYEEDILRSGDVIVLQSELDDSMFKLEQLELNLKRVQIEDEDLRTRAGKWKERGKKAAERREVDVRDACRERAKELEERGAKVGKKVTKINDMIRKQRRWVGRVEAVLKDVRDGKEGVSKQKEQTSKPKNREEAVDDELERMRKELGL